MIKNEPLYKKQFFIKAIRKDKGEEGRMKTVCLLMSIPLLGIKTTEGIHQTRGSNHREVAH